MPGALPCLFHDPSLKAARSQLAEQYGADVASEVLARSRSNLQLDSLPTMPYTTGPQANLSPLALRQEANLPRAP